MNESQYQTYTMDFCAALEKFSSVQGIVAIGSTASANDRDQWSDHDFAIVLRDGESDRFLRASDWMPKSGDIIAHAYHADIYAAAIYENGHKVEYLVCAENTAATITVTRFSVLLDRGGVQREFEIAQKETLSRQERLSQEFVPENVAIILATATERTGRGEFLSAASLVNLAADILLHIILHQLRSNGLPLSDPLDPRRKLEQVMPDMAASLIAVLQLPPTKAVPQLVEFANNFIRPETTRLNWSSFDRVMATAKLGS